VKEQQNIEWKQAWRDDSGQLPPDWSLARMMAKHPSQPANPDIARALFLAGKIESWGRGIDLIRNACLAAAGPAPRFDCDSTGFWVEFPFPALTEGDGTSVKNSVKTPAAILGLLAATPAMTLAEVAAEVGKTSRAVELAAAKLVKEGRLKYVGPQKGGHWEVLN
jgi:ATP-dependent DNA helicase RecG